MKKGKLYGVGVGPGDPELMTLKAVRLIKEADLIAVPHRDKSKCLALRIASGAVPELDDKEILEISMPMILDMKKREMAYKAGADKLAKVLDEEKTVVFLTLGDPSVFSTYYYLHEKLVAAGYDCELVSGVPSFCAVAAALNTSLCQDKEELHIIPGVFNPDKALAYPGTKVLMKNDIPTTKNAVIERGLSAMMVENCGSADQHIYNSVEEIPDKVSYFSVVVVKEEKE